DYEKIVSLEKALREQDGDGQLTSADRDRLAVELYAYRSGYLSRAANGTNVPLSQTQSHLGREDWYHIAAGKGVLVLHELRKKLGDDVFERVMDSFGREHAGREVTTGQFRAHVEKVSGKDLETFFNVWLNHAALPTLELDKVTVTPAD